MDYVEQVRDRSVAWNALAHFDTNAKDDTNIVGPTPSQLGTVQALIAEGQPINQFGAGP